MSAETEKKAGGGQLLDGKRVSMWVMDPDDLVIIGVDTDDGPEHHLYDERADVRKKPLLEEHIVSMRSLGVLEVAKVVVMEISTKKSKKPVHQPVLINGRRRTLHAREANRRIRESNKGKSEENREPLLTIRVEATSEKKTSEEFQALAGIAMNEHREDDDILTKAAKAARMVNRGGDKILQKTAMAFRVDVQTIQSWIKISSAGPAARKALVAGQLEATAVAAIADLPKEQQAAAVEEAIAAGGGTKATVAVTKAVVAAVRSRAAGGDGEVKIKPSGRLITKVIAFAKLNETNLPDGFVLGLRYARGEVRNVKGLSEVIRELEKESA